LYDAVGAPDDEGAEEVEGGVDGGGKEGEGAGRGNGYDLTDEKKDVG